MAQIAEPTSNEDLPKDVTSMSLFLTSIRDFTKDNEVEIAITKVGNAYPDSYDNVGIRCELFVSGDIEKVRGFVLKDNDYVITKDMAGNEVRELRMIEGDEISEIVIPYHLKMKPSEKDAKIERGDNDINIRCTEYKSCYPVVFEGLKAAGCIPEDTKFGVDIITTPAELKEALEGFEFKGSHEHIKLKKYNYDRLAVKVD